MSIPQEVVQKYQKRFTKSNCHTAEAVTVKDKTDYELMYLSREGRLALYNIESFFVPISNNQQNGSKTLNAPKNKMESTKKLRKLTTRFRVLRRNAHHEPLNLQQLTDQINIYQPLTNVKRAREEKYN